MSGDEERDKGMALAETKHYEWHRRFDHVVDRYIKSGRFFTVEDVVQEIGLPSGEIGGNKIIGAAMSGIVRSGRLTRVGYTKARRTTSHSRQLSVWSSKVASGQRCHTCGR